MSAKREAILEAVRGVEEVLKDPPPAVVIKAINPASVELIIQAWISNSQHQRPVFSRS
jgi:small-conductance mechanosensitive channel